MTTYNANRNYQQEINDAKAAGKPQSVIDQLTKEREAKIAGENLNADGTKKSTTPTTVNKSGLSGQSAVMASHLDNYLRDAVASGNQNLISYAEDKVRQFNSLNADQKYLAGQYRPTQVDNYRAANLGAAKDVYSYRYDPRTGKEYGNLNLANPDYDVFRDDKYKLMPMLIEQQKRDALADYQRNAIQSGKDWTADDTAWLLSYFEDQDAKLRKGYRSDGYMEGSANTDRGINPEAIVAAAAAQLAARNNGKKSSPTAKYAEVNRDRYQAPAAQPVERRPITRETTPLLYQPADNPLLQDTTNQISVEQKAAIVSRAKAGDPAAQKWCNQNGVFY